MNILTPPKADYTDYYEAGAFEITWKLSVYMLITYPIFTVLGWIMGDMSLVIGLLLTLLPAGCLFLLKKTEEYKLVAYIYVSTGMIFPGLILNLNFVPVHSSEILFMVVNILYAFISLRRKAGVFASCVHFGWLIVYLIRFPSLEHTLENYNPLFILIPSLMGLGLIVVLLIEFLQLRKKSEQKYKKANEELVTTNALVNAQYEEKTVMLKEIHHRVKNNLQVISSLLRLQSYEIEDESLQTHFQDAVYRVSAMALIHEKMYQNENLSKINFINYVETLAADLIRTHGQDVPVSLEVTSDIEGLGNDTLVPLALILNELITNSLKHAFTQTPNGRIVLRIEKIERENYFRFIYRDNGTWREKPKGSSFGLELIATLTEQLDGKIDRTYDKGTRYEFILRDLTQGETRF